MGTTPRRGLLLLLAIALVSIACGWWLREVWFGEAKSAGADVKLIRCQELLEKFDAYPLVYLGDSFEGLPLTYCARRQSAGSDYGRPATESFFFIYGDCVIQPGRDSCAPPLQVIVYPRCGPSLAGGVMRAESVRGVTAKVLATPAYFIETPYYNVKVSGGNRTRDAEALTRSAIEQLRGANALAEPLTRDKSLADATLLSLPAPTKDACEDDDTLKSGVEPTPTPGTLALMTTPALLIDADPSNGDGAYATVDSMRTISQGASLAVALCLLNPELPPVNGGLTSLRLVVSYTTPPAGIVVAPNLSTDLDGNPNWNQAVSTGAWDCNVLNSAGTAPRAASPSWILCDSTTLANQPFSGAEHLATLSFSAVSSSGTATISWSSETEMVSGSDGISCDGVTLQCVGAEIIVSAP
jgi:hypothetical protein